MDAAILAVVVAIVVGTGIPLFEAASRRAKTSALLENLHVLRSQIERYKLDHDGRVPVVHEGTLPQLIYATNAEGVPGTSGNKAPFGPYLRSGVPVNPLTGRSIVTLTGTFPPGEPSGNGGWLYHQPTGQMAPDVEGFLDR